MLFDLMYRLATQRDLCSTKISAVHTEGDGNQQAVYRLSNTPKLTGIKLKLPYSVRENVKHTCHLYMQGIWYLT